MKHEHDIYVMSLKRRNLSKEVARLAVMSDMVRVKYSLLLYLYLICKSLNRTYPRCCYLSYASRSPTLIPLPGCITISALVMSSSSV
jgi:hypothetical protein